MVDQGEELPLLPFGNPVGAVPAASRGVSLIIKFYFVSFVLFVVIFLSRYNLLTLSENVLYRAQRAVVDLLSRIREQDFMIGVEMIGFVRGRPVG